MASIDLTDTAPAEGVRTLQLRALASRELPIRLRGYDPDAVDELREDLFSFCADVERQLSGLFERSRVAAMKESDVAALEGEVGALTQRVSDLEHELREAAAARDDLVDRLATAEAAAATDDDTGPRVDVYTEAGDEVAAVLRSARHAADDLLRVAEELAESTQRDAEETAERWRADATHELDAARHAADELLEHARREASDLVAGAHRDAADIVETARRAAQEIADAAEADLAAAAAQVAALQQAEQQLRVGLQTAGQWLLRTAAGELAAPPASTPFPVSA